MSSKINDKITAVILTKNEELRLELIFENLKDFAKIIVCDGGSTDGTKALCEKYGVKFVERPPGLRNISGADQKFSFAQVETEYMLYVNCSHYYPVKLLEKFKEVANEGKYHAVHHDYVIYTYGSIVHRPFFRRRASGCNFYRKDSINYDNSIIHNEAPVELPENLKLRLPATDEYSIHLFRDYNVTKSEANHGLYSLIEAEERFKAGARTSFLKILYKPAYKFLHQYVRCGSIIRGIPGFIYAVSIAELELSVQMRIWEFQNNLSMDNIIKIHQEMRHELYKSKF